MGHVAIDSSGMLMDATGEPVTAVGDTFVVHMDREALNDFPMGQYDVTVKIITFEPDREIAWTILGQIKPPIGHVYGYRLEPDRRRHARHLVLRLVDDRPDVEGGRHLPDHPRVGAARHARDPRPHRHARAGCPAGRDGAGEPPVRGSFPAGNQTAERWSGGDGDPDRASESSVASGDPTPARRARRGRTSPSSC